MHTPKAVLGIEFAECSGLAEVMRYFFEDGGFVMLSNDYLV